jgi:micrococcal nuclease
MLGFRGLRRRRAPAALALFILAAIAAALLRYPGGAPSGDRLPAAPGDAETAQVERVVDGDTIRLRGVGPVRLIGIDTPETHGGRTECFGPEATRYVEGLLPRGARVRYVVGEEARDRYGRLLVYLYTPDGAALNQLLVSGGYATALTIAPNDRYARTFRRAERAARRKRSGMWARAGCAGDR